MSDRALRTHLLELLEGKSAHIDIGSALEDFPLEGINTVVDGGATHTAWQLLEHIRIAQSDILEFSRDAKHVSPQWPEGYWPKSEKPSSDAAWKKSIASIKKDALSMQKLVGNPKTDLYAKIPHGTGQNV